jgi:hypothetical protein
LRLSECWRLVKRITIARRSFRIHFEDWNEPLSEAESASGPANAGFVAGGPSIRRDLPVARGLTLAHLLHLRGHGSQALRLPHINVL